MIKLILIILAIMVGLIMGPYLGTNGVDFLAHKGWGLPPIPSVIKISTDVWGGIETTLPRAILGIVLIIVVLVLIAKLLRFIFNIPKGTSNWFSDRKAKKVRYEAYQGINSLLVGNYTQAEKNALANVNRSELPVVNYLVAAYAAQGQNNIEKRNHFLNKAEESSKVGDSLLIDLSKARMQLESKEYKSAYENLHHLYNLNGQNIAVLNLYKEACVGFNKWAELREFLPKLLKKNIITEAENDSLLEQIAVNGIKQEGERSGKDGIINFLNGLPRKDRKSLPFAYTAVDQLIAHDANDEALTIFKNQLKNETNDEFIRLALRFKLDNYKDLISRLDNMAPKTQVLYSVIGQLHIKEKNWIAAKDYLEKAVSFEQVKHENVEVQGLLRVYEQLNDKEAIPQLAHKLLNNVGHREDDVITANIAGLDHKVEAKVVKEVIVPVDTKIEDTVPVIDDTLSDKK